MGGPDVREGSLRSMNPGSWGPGCVIGVTQNGPTIILDRGRSKWAPMHSKPRSSIGVIQQRLPEGSNASLLHPEAAGSRAGGSGPQPEASEASRGVIQQRLPEGSKASLLQPEAAGGRPDAGRRQAGGRPEAGRKQAGSRPEAGRTQAGSRAGGSWIGLLQNRNPHRCAMEGGVKDPMGRHDVR